MAFNEQNGTETRKKAERPGLFTRKWWDTNWTKEQNENKEENEEQEPVFTGREDKKVSVNMFLEKNLSKVR